MRQFHILLVFAGVTVFALLWPSPASADVVLVSAERAFFAEADTTSREEEDDEFFDLAFEHFNPLDFDLTANAAISGATALGLAHQQSTITTELLQADGLSRGAATSTGEEIFSSGFAETYYTIVFELTEPTLVHLTGFLSATEYADAELQLEDPEFNLLLDLFVTDGET